MPSPERLGEAGRSRRIDGAHVDLVKQILLVVVAAASGETLAGLVGQEQADHGVEEAGQGVAGPKEEVCHQWWDLGGSERAEDAQTHHAVGAFEEKKINFACQNSDMSLLKNVPWNEMMKIFNR